jgi:phosphatidylinositol alpha-1,6-mannosyltransferase
MARILFVSKPVAPPWNDSSKNLVRDVVSHMTRHQPVVLGPHGANTRLGRATIDEIYPEARGGFAPGLIDNGRVLARLLLGARHDLWHFFFAPNPRTSTVARVTSGVRRQRTVQTVCSAPRDDVDPRRVLFADRTIVLSRHTELRLLNAGVAATSLVRIPPAAPRLDLPTAGQRMATRAQLGLPADAPLVLFPGDLEFGTGAERSLQVVAQLPTSLGACLVMACRAKTPRAMEEEQRLRALAITLGLAKRTYWLGETSRILDLLGASDVVLLPSETLYAKMDLPLVLLEAMALSRPVVVVTGVPAAELAEGGGALAVNPSVPEICATVAELLESESRCVDLGQRAREIARTNYDPAAVASAYETVYDALLKES